MKQQERTNIVLARLLELINEDPILAGLIDAELETMLNSLHNEDMFGTEGQSDPRGDFRNGKWSIWDIEDYK